MKLFAMVLIFLTATTRAWSQNADAPVNPAANSSKYQFLEVTGGANANLAQIRYDNSGSTSDTTVVTVSGTMGWICDSAFEPALGINISNSSSSTAVSTVKLEAGGLYNFSRAIENSYYVGALAGGIHAATSGHSANMFAYTLSFGKRFSLNDFLQFNPQILFTHREGTKSDGFSWNEINELQFYVLRFSFLL